MSGRYNRYPKSVRERACRSSETNIGSDFGDDELEFLQAIDRYKRSRQRPYPTWREVLAVLRSLGYRQVCAKEELP